VGKVAVGGDNPIRIQSMTTSNTRDVVATVEQIMRLADYGCEIARVTVQGMKEADACEGIKNTLVQRGYDIPLVADIHFYPPAAMRVVDFVDKVRVNPGNFVDKRATFKTLTYDTASYQAELDRIEEKFSPLVEKCKKLKRSMRIGTNHGSLSDRIMNYYGDTPRGMVESAFEFLRVCIKMNYHDVIFSMKASNPIVMIEAYRLLVTEMMKEGWDYPLHLGVTEAGEGEDGRIKSAVGIGTLLLDGIGETIRVSLTEDPWEEIEPCKELISWASSYKERDPAPFQPVRAPKIAPPLHRDGSVLLYITQEQLKEPNFLDQIGCSALQKRKDAPDALIIEEWPGELPVMESIRRHNIGLITRTPGVAGTIWLQERKTFTPTSQSYALDVQPGEEIKGLDPQFVIFHGSTHQGRTFFAQGIDCPVILASEAPLIKASAEMGALLTDKCGDGLALPLSKRLFGFALLQASRMRTSRTEFISCPGCGRTLFNLQDVARRIREKTSHLPGVKIAIMGCIVNGPGEMADADFGYVGSKPGKIDLYVGKERVEADIDHAEADERLIELIKKHGRWIEPNVELVTI